MKAIINLTPKITLEIEENDNKETLAMALNLAAVRNYCTECSAPTKPELQARKAKDAKGKEFTYIEAVCKNKIGNDPDGKAKLCWAKSGLGEYQAGGYYWKKYERYEGNNEDGE